MRLGDARDVPVGQAAFVGTFRGITNRCCSDCNVASETTWQELQITNRKSQIAKLIQASFAQHEYSVNRLMQ